MAHWFKTLFAANGTKAAVPNAADPSGYISYDIGYGPDYQRVLGTDPLAKTIERDKLNQVLYDITGAVQQYQTHGFPDYIDATANGGAAYAYDVGAVVRFTDGLNYQNTIAGNTNAPNISGWANYGNQLIKTIAALRLTPYAGQPIISVTGYYTASDNIGVREYYWDALSVEADNGGTIIQVTGVVTGRWKMKDSGAVNVKWFGAKGDGATDDTLAIKNTIDCAILSFCDVIIPSANYLVTTGVLEFDNSFIDTRFPTIYTSGFEETIFTVNPDTATADPIITIKNGTATSGAGNYWNGGGINGGITFVDSTVSAISTRHAISLRGVWSMNFGPLIGNGIKGSVIYIEPLLYGGTNPDPYAVTFCDFERVEGNYVNGYVFENQNFAGFNGCVIKAIRGIGTLKGGLYGFGTGNRIDLASLGSCAGTAFDDGCSTSNVGGSPVRTSIGVAEIDDVQYGFKLNVCSMLEAKQIRFNHRYNFSSLNTSNKYWPLIAVDMGGGTLSPAVSDIEMNIIHRVESGGLKADLGLFNNFNSIATRDITIDNRILDNGGLGVLDSDLYSNRNVNGDQVVKSFNKIILDDRFKANMMARGDATTAVLNSGWGTATSKVLIPTELSDKYGIYATSEATIPYDGLYFVKFKFILTTGAVGTFVRHGIMRNRSAALAVMCEQFSYSATTGNQHYEVSGILNLVKGDIIYPIANQNTATASITCTAVASQDADNIFQVFAL